jgi:sulfate permease, SulP family
MSATAPAMPQPSTSGGALNRPAGLLTDVSAALITAIVTLTFALSYAALIFAGPLSAGQPLGVVAAVTSVAMGGLVVALFSSIPFNSASPDGNSSAMMAAMAASAAADMAAQGLPDRVKFATVIVALMQVSMLSGLALLSLGLARAGKLARLLPYQVMAGFLGATGLVLVKGGAVLAAGVSLGLALLSDPEGCVRIAASCAMAGVMLVLLKRLTHPLALPALMAGFTVLHHAVFGLLHIGLEEQRARGWLTHFPSGLSFEYPWASARVAAVDWQVLLHHAPDFLAIAVVCLIPILLSIGALETASGIDADVDRELAANGAGAIVSGLAGGMLGYTSFTRSLLLLRAGGKARRAAVMAALFAPLLVAIGGPVLTRLPSTVLSAMMILLGAQLVEQWIFRARRQLSPVEWLIALLVVAISVALGFTYGVFAGLLVCCVSVAVAASRVPPVRARYRGELARSTVDRPEIEAEYLRVRADTLLVMHLQGHLFFGTMSRLLADIRQEIAAMPGVLSHILLDCRGVAGLDGTALAGFARLRQAAASGGVRLVFAGLAPRLAARLPASEASHRFADLDAALEWREDEILSGHVQESEPTRPLAGLFDDDLGVHEAPLFAALLPLQVPAGCVIVERGTASDDLFLLESGRAVIEAETLPGQSVRLRTLGPGTMFGEFGFLLGMRRTATVRADTDCRLWCLSRAALAELERERPATALAFHHALVGRLGTRMIERDSVAAALAGSLLRA